nr:efflux RND transporter permease subunit [Dissulfurirhabdus thermomarina]
MARNPVAANLLMMVFVVGGVVMGTAIKQEIFPEVLLDRIRISVAYPGATPADVEEGVILPIEENIRAVDGIKEVQAVAAEGLGTVVAEIHAGEDADRILQDIKSEVDRITTFPRDAEEPVIAKVVNRRQVLSVVVYGDVPERTLREQAERIRDDLLALPEISQVDLGGVRPYEIAVEIPEENLRRYNLTLEQVAQRIRRASLDVPGGVVKAEGGEILLRTKERRDFAPGYADIVVVEAADGTRVRLGEIARVRDTFEETDTSARFDGMPAAMVDVFRIGDQKPIDISRAVRRYVARKAPELPPSLHLATWNDRSEILRDRERLLLKNAAMGFVLVFVTLGLFLQIRLAFWVMLGIPISFLGALFFMPALDVSINMISLFAFIMALGIVVDDAIVVGENVFEHRQRGKDYLRAAVDGVREVGVPVIFSVLTTVAAFVPLAAVSGMMGKFIRVIPLVVISILSVSLVESLFVLPAHLGHGRPRPPRPGGFAARWVDRPRRWVAARLDGFIRGPYARLLALSLKWRYVSVAVAVAVLLVTFGLVKGGILKFRFMPEVDGDVIRVHLEMPRGTPVDETARAVAEIVRKGRRVAARFDKDAEGGRILRHVYTVVGGTMAAGGPGATGATSSGGHLADIAMLLVKSEYRDVAAADVNDAWRRAVGEVPGAEVLTFTSNVMRLGANIDVRLAHEDFAVLKAAARRVKAALAGFRGVGDIADDNPPGKREFRFRLTPAALTLGVTEEDLGRQIRSFYYGAEALRLQRGRNEVKVMVRYPAGERHRLASLDRVRIRTPGGGELPLRQAATVTETRGYSEIHRVDQKRVVDVTASVDSRSAEVDQIKAALAGGVLRSLAADYPGLSYSFEGEEKERRESMASMMRGFALALFAIYALLAIPFRSYVQPLIIMAAIPFGVVGAAVGHLVMGYNLSILSLFGIVALSGVVVNDSLLLIDQVNRNRAEGMVLLAAVKEAGRRRFRPILLTSLTTFFGLTPMILETSVQARFLIPMAISLGFGILFATGITLLLIPSLYLVAEDLRRLAGRVLRRERATA